MGDPPSDVDGPGTINLLAWLSVPLAEGALVEALSIATEARTAAVLESGLPSARSGRPATGTGTDCVVVACPPGKAPLDYAGKHTLAGSLLGSAVYEAVRRGMVRWRSRWEVAHACPRS